MSEMGRLLKSYLIHPYRWKILQCSDLKADLNHQNGESWPLNQILDLSQFTNLRRETWERTLLCYTSFLLKNFYIVLMEFSWLDRTVDCPFENSIMVSDRWQYLVRLGQCPLGCGPCSKSDLTYGALSPKTRIYRILML